MTSTDHPICGLFQAWMRIVNKLDILEKIPADYGVDTLLHPSEIHLLQAVGDNPGSNLSTIATTLGITRGAASQKVTQMVRKGFVRKVRGEVNEKEIFLFLTKAGSVAYSAHEVKHTEVYAQIARRTGDLSPEEIKILSRFFSAAEAVFDERITEKQNELAEKRRRRHTKPPASDILS